MKTLRAIALVLLATAGSALAQPLPLTYYVSASGSDVSAGTSPASAWRTIARVNGGSYAAGTRILFEGGSTFSGTLRFDTDRLHGSADNPVVVGSYGSAPATLDAGTNDGIDVINGAGIRITNLNLVGSSGAQGVLSKSAISFTGTAPKSFGIYLDHLDITGFSLAGVFLQASGHSNGYQKIRIDEVHVRSVGYVGIGLYGDEVATFQDLSITHSDFSTIEGYLTAYGTKVEGAGDGISITGLLSGTISNNAIHNNGDLSIGASGIRIANAAELTIAENEIYENRTSTTASGAAIDLGSGIAGATVQYNYTHENDGAFLRVCSCGAPTHDILARFNISERDAAQNNGASIVLNGPIDTFSALRNTVVASNGDAAILIDGESPYANVRFFNNLFVAENGVAMLHVVDPGNATNLLFLGNDWFPGNDNARFIWGGTTYNSLSSFAAGTNEETNGPLVGFSAEPQLYGGPQSSGGTMNPRPLSNLTTYRIAPNSPLIDKAIDVTPYGLSEGNRDFYGGYVGVGFGSDVGAYEYTPDIYQPAIEPIADQTVIAGEIARVDVRPTDPDGTDHLVLSIEAPSFITLDGDQLVIAPPRSGFSLSEVIVHVTDFFGHTATTSFQVTVLSNPIVVTPPPTIPRKRLVGH